MSQMMSNQLQSQNCKSSRTDDQGCSSCSHTSESDTGRAQQFSVTERFSHRQSLLMSHCYRPELSLKYNPMTLEGKNPLKHRFSTSTGSCLAVLIKPSLPCKYPLLSTYAPSLYRLKIKLTLSEHYAESALLYKWWLRCWIKHSSQLYFYHITVYQMALWGLAMAVMIIT